MSYCIFFYLHTPIKLKNYNMTLNNYTSAWVQCYTKCREEVNVQAKDSETPFLYLCSTYSKNKAKLLVEML